VALAFALVLMRVVKRSSINKYEKRRLCAICCVLCVVRCAAKKGIKFFFSFSPMDQSVGLSPREIYRAKRSPEWSCTSTFADSNDNVQLFVPRINVPAIFVLEI
jgi:hypothetical protein